MTATTELLQTGGLNPHERSPNPSQTLTPRRRGLKQGLFIFLLTFLVVPLIALITLAFNAKPFGVAIAAVLFFMGGLLRMAYALMFESVEPGGPTLEDKIMGNTPAFKSQLKQPMLPEPSVAYVGHVTPRAGNWRDTNELAPPSVVEGTTQLLEKDEIPQ